MLENPPPAKSWKRSKLRSLATGSGILGKKRRGKGAGGERGQTDEVTKGSYSFRSKR